MDYTITLTETENKAMQYVAEDVYAWIDNAAKNRAHIAIDEICRIYTEYKLTNNEPITTIGKDEMVMAAFNEGIVSTLEQQDNQSTLST
jgi:hypothetical protein